MNFAKKHQKHRFIGFGTRKLQTFEVHTGLFYPKIHNLAKFSFLDPCYLKKITFLQTSNSRDFFDKSGFLPQCGFIDFGTRKLQTRVKTMLLL